MLTFSSSLAMCLAMGNAFVFRAPNVAPSKSARGNQADVIAPLGATSRGLGTGGALARFSDNGDMEGEQHLPRVPAEGCYRGWGSRAICPPLHASKGVEVRAYSTFKAETCKLEIFIFRKAITAVFRCMELCHGTWYLV